MNVAKLFMSTILAAVVAAAGVFGGWYARSQTDHAAPGSSGGSAAGKAAQGPLFSEEALRNMGVTFAQSHLSDYTVTREVPARIAGVRSSLRPVIARWGGTVSRILPSEDGSTDSQGPEEFEGAVVFPGDVIVEMIRAPIPPMDRKLTGDVVQAISEPIHEAAADLRSARRALDVATMEWERVKKLLAGDGELPVVPRQTEINLRYEVLKAEAEMERVRARLFLHGLTAEQIDAAANGTVVPPGPGLWRRALERNGLWPENGDDMLALLPSELRANPWTFAALGELNALGRCDEPLLHSMEHVEDLGVRFHEIASLLMQGHSLEDAVDIFASGALDPIARIRTPEGPPDWDVRKVLVTPGEKVEAGTVLALLADNRRVTLVIEAAGADLALVQSVAENCEELTARPLIESGAPVLEGVVITSFTESDADRDGPKAYALVENFAASVGSPDDRLARRAWRLRPGMRYMVRVPVSGFSGRHVIPRNAVVNEGAERVIFIRREEEFIKKPVHVEYEDHECAVLAKDATIDHEDEIAVSGALALSLALKSKGAVKEEEEHVHGPT